MDTLDGSVHHLLESWGDEEGILVDSKGQLMSESISNNIIKFPNNKNLVFKENEVYITGTFMQADIVNGNKRVYPRGILDSAINQYMEQRVKRGKALGEWNHPEDRVEVDHTQGVLLIEDLWWEGSDVKGKAIVTTGDYAGGDKIASLLRIGWKPSVSSRGVGRLDGNMRRDGYMTVGSYRISVGIDFVHDPSAPNANVDVVGFNESRLEESVTINNSIRKTNNQFDRLIQNLKKYGNSN